MCVYLYVIQKLPVAEAEAIQVTAESVLSRQFSLVADTISMSILEKYT